MSRNHELFEQALRIMPGGVNSPVRSFAGVGGTPRMIEAAHGAYLVDVDGKQYVDYIGSWGAMLLGHGHPAVIADVTQALEYGLSYGAPSPNETKLAEAISTLMPSIESIRLLNSGTEATMTAIRLARGYTKRAKIIKFAGCYHGHTDSLLVQAGSGALTCGQPSSAGIPTECTQHTLVARYNDSDHVTQLFAQYGDQIAAIIVEPIAGNMNCILPLKGFLAHLRELCDQYQALLIFDEVMTGFRVALTGAQGIYDVCPDLTTLGKIIGGGLPVGALGGRRDIMAHLAPLGNVYQAGTLSGNPIAVAAGLATLEVLSQPRFYDTLSAHTGRLVTELVTIGKKQGVALCANTMGGMFGLFFTDTSPVTHYQQVLNCDVTRFKAFFHGMLDAGIHFAPSAFEAGFVSSAHGDAEIDKTLEAAERVLAKIA